MFGYDPCANLSPKYTRNLKVNILIGNRLKVFEPTASERIDIDLLASRPETLNGKVLGLLNNTKDQSDIILDQLEHQLKDQFDDAEIKYYRKPSVSGMPGSMKDRLVEEVDLLITATGD